MFKRQDSTARTANATPAGYSVLDAQMVVRGDLETDGMLRIDGRLEGNILRAGVVVLGEGAAIVGNVNARELVIGGTGYLWGGVIGAVVFKLLHDLLSAWTPQYWTFWIGLFLVVLVLVGRERLFRPRAWWR